MGQRKRLIVLAGALVGLGLLVSPRAARGLQFYFFYETPYSDGGSGGDYFTGSPRFKRYDCRICHIGAPGKTRVDLRTEPQDIFEYGYRPGETYTVRLTLEKETRGFVDGLFGNNNFCIEVLDAGARRAGTFDTGFTTTPLSQLFDPIVLSPDGRVIMNGIFNDALEWRWFWTAPEPGTGPVVFHGGFVDGDGDLKTFGDDVAVIRQPAVEHPHP